MSKPWIHSLSSAKKHGGKPEDYLDIHNWFDQSKGHFPSLAHRAILHTSFGIFLAEQMFGVKRTNSDNREYSVRDIGEQHCLEDHGNKFIPTVQDYLGLIPTQPWMEGKGLPPSCQNLSNHKSEDTTKYQVVD